MTWTLATLLPKASPASPRAASKAQQTRGGIGLKNSFELMQELFADLRRGTGAIVISSASVKEFAFESDAWHNGVFTYEPASASTTFRSIEEPAHLSAISMLPKSFPRSEPLHQKQPSVLTVLCAAVRVVSLFSSSQGLRKRTSHLPRSCPDEHR